MFWNGRRRRLDLIGLGKMRPRILGEDVREEVRVREVIREADIPHVALSESESESDELVPIRTEESIQRVGSIMDLKFELPTDLELKGPVLSLDSFSWTKSPGKLESFDTDIFDAEMF